MTAICSDAEVVQAVGTERKKRDTGHEGRLKGSGAFKREGMEQEEGRF